MKTQALLVALIAMLLSAPADAPAQAGDAARPERVQIAAAAKPGALKNDVFAAVNRERQKQGLPALARNGKLNKAAQAHAADMARRGALSHTGGDGSNFGQRMQRQGYRFRAGAENVAAGQQDAAAVMKSWMNSAGHRGNILNKDMKHIGVGFARASDGQPYWVQVFGAPL